MTDTWFTELKEALSSSEKDTKESRSIWASLASHVDINGYQPHPHPQVIAKEIQDKDGNYFVLKNAERKTYLRLSPDEYNLWLGMNEKKTVKELVVDHFVSSGAFAQNMVIQLVYQLRANHMLLEEPKYVWGNIRQELQKRSWGYKFSQPASAVLKQQLKIPGMDRITTLIHRSIGWVFFTKPVQWVLALIAIAGFIFFNRIMANPDYVLFQQIQASELLLFWVASLLPIVIHELGHALTVKNYGREVNAGGLMLYFGLPAAYVDTTDIWLEGRRARLNVTWNGPYTGLVIGGICAMVMWFNPGYEFNSFLFKMASVAYLTVFINVNPLLKYDGYYILSDFLGITFLRERSMNFIQKSLLRKITRREKFMREEKIFAVFGVLSMVWTAYALYLTAVFWRTRMSTGLQVLLGSNYGLLSKVLSFLSTAALFSLSALLTLQLIRFIATLINGYVRKGGLQRHTQLALIGAILSAALAFGLPRLSQNNQGAIFLALGCGIPLATGISMLRFNRSYYLSNRWQSQLVFSIMAFVLGLIPVIVQFADPAYGIYLIGLAIFLSILGGILFILPAMRQIKPAQILTGLLAVALLAIPSLNLNLPIWTLALISATAMIATLDWFSLRGGGRSPAPGLIHVGVMVTAVGFVLNRADERVWVMGILLACAGIWHLILARLPDLSKIDFPISSNKKDAVGFSVAILVRRVIAQVFFESGWAGIHTFANRFSEHMKTLGINLSITGNQFNDGELPNRQTFDLTEVYGNAFDKIYELLKDRFGDGYARLTIGRGIDLIPWQYREVIGELVLARREWGEVLNQESQDRRSKRIKLLDRVSLFISATYDDLRPIAAMLEPRQYAAGETIIRQGEPGKEFFIIESGKVQIWQQREGMEAEQVNALGAGQYFGEVALVTDAPRNATVIAETPSVLLTLERDDFDTLVKHHLAFAKNIKTNIHSKWILRNMPILDELDAMDLNYLANMLKTETFKAGGKVITQGDIADKFYIVQSGELRIYQEANGRTIELDRHSPGDYFGEIALLNKSPRTANVIAVTDVELLSLEADKFQNLLGDFSRMKQSVEKTGSRRLQAS